MEDYLLRQDNRITAARYEFSLIEKRVIYYVLKEIRQQFVLREGQRDLFNDLVLKIEGASLLKEVYKDNRKAVMKALHTLRVRDFYYKNNKQDDKYLTVGFINYGEWKNGIVEVQVSHKILPFYVELTKNYTEYSLLVAMGLKSKWSQRMYELCAQWRSTGGFKIRIDELRQMFMLENEYDRYASLKKFVLDVAQNEIKALYDKGECDLYFNYSELKIGRSVETLSFKIIVKDNENQYSLTDYDYFIRTELHSLFATATHPKNKVFVEKVMTVLRKNPDTKLEPCYKKILYVNQNIPAEERVRYMRFVLNEEYLSNNK